MKYINNNSVSDRHTHFICGVQMVTQAREEFKISSENWTEPRYHFGHPVDNDYYSEVWLDGMDWDLVYWALEKYNHEPKILPLLYFEDSVDRNKIPEFEFNQIIKALCTYRQNKLWFKKEDVGYFSDSVWSYITITDVRYKDFFIKVKFEHASQKAVEFYIHKDFIPEKYMNKTSKYEEQLTEKFITCGKYNRLKISTETIDSDHWTKKDAETFFNELDNPKPPNEKLKNAAKKYNENIEQNVKTGMSIFLSDDENSELLDDDYLDNFKTNKKKLTRKERKKIKYNGNRRNKKSI